MYINIIFPVAATLATIVTADIIQNPTAADFDLYLQSNDRTFVSFTSQNLESLSTFDNAFISVAEESSTLSIILDCNQEPEVCSDYDVNAYPTIRLFEKSKEDGEISMTRYRGRRTKHAMRSFLRKRELPLISHVSQKNLTEFKMIDDIVVVAYLRPDQDQLLQGFESAAARHRLNYVLGYSTDSALADAESVPVPSVVCYKNTDGDNKVLNGHFTEVNVYDFLQTATKSVISDFSEREAHSFMIRDKLTVYIFVDKEDSATAIRHELTPLAKKYEIYVIFAIVDLERHLEMAENFGIADSREGHQTDKPPALVVHAPLNDNMFRYKQGRKIEATAVEGMLTTILKGKAVNGQVFAGTADSGMHSEL